MKRFNILILILTIFLSGGALSMEKVKIASSASGAPYSFLASEGCSLSKGGVPLTMEDGSRDLICGFEVDLFSRICEIKNLDCHWVYKKWHGGEYNRQGDFFFKKGTVFSDLINPLSDNTFEYDISVNMSEASFPRRKLMLFSSSYFASWHNLIGRPELKGRIDLDSEGFPKDKVYNSRKLKIGTWSGFLIDQLALKYKSPQNITIQGFSDPISELENGNIDLLFSYIGIDQKLIEKGFKLISDKIEVLGPIDPFAGVGAATRVSKKGRVLQEQLSDGLVQLKCNKEYDKISKKWVGSDVWDYKLGPLINESVCQRYNP
jgi:ABC-type amino acid transport substrate-binding protein